MGAFSDGGRFTLFVCARSSVVVAVVVDAVVAASIFLYLFQKGAGKTDGKLHMLIFASRLSGFIRQAGKEMPFST